MTDPALFGTLILDRDPVAFVHFWGLVQAWLQSAGGCAAVGLAAYFFYAVIGASDSPSNKLRMPVTTWMLGMFAVSIVLYAVLLVLIAAGRGPHPQVVKMAMADPNAYMKYEPPIFSWAAQPTVSMFAGLAAVLGIGQPFFRDLFKLKFRRIFAIAKLGFKEAVRSKIFWVFLVVVVPFLFPVKWFFSIKPEDELRTTVRVTSIVMELMLLLAAGLLAAFSVPNDIKNQNIYTIVSKPVERFEIVLGRLLGFVALTTIALVVMAAGSIFLIGTSSIDDKAKEETYKARVPHRGTLEFKSRKGAIEGTNVGREFDYRRYIGGAPQTSERAVWNFDTIPATLTAGSKGAVQAEFAFDIFRLTKGEENRGVDINVRVTSWQCEQAPPTAPRDGTWRWTDTEKEKQYREERTAIDEKLKRGELGAGLPRSLDFARPGTEAWDLVNQLAEKYGFYEYATKEIFDFHPDGIPVPTGLFKNAREGTPPAALEGPKPRASVYVKCTSGGQMLGMAEGDLYLLEGTQPFAVNYFKSLLGLWCRVVIVIAVALAFSQYFAGIVSLLGAAFVYVSANLAPHMQTIANQNTTGGGPFESMTRLIRSDTPTGELEKNAVTRTAVGLDSVNAWVFRQFSAVVPDVDAFTWTHYLKEGFNVNAEYMAMNLLLVFGYVLPWGVLAYFLLRNREVAA